MSPLLPRTLTLLRVGRGGHEPSPEQISRVRRSLFVKLGAAGAAAAVGTTTASVSAASSIGLGLAAKVVAGIGVLVVGGFGGLYWAGSPSEHGLAVQPAEVAERPPQAAVVVPTPKAVPPSGAQALTDTPAPGPSATAAAAASRVAPSSLTTQPSPEDQLLEEARLLGQAQRQLGAGSAAEALQTLSEYDRRFGAGALRAEADAARVFALCRSGRGAEARTEADRFVRRHPMSPAVGRVRQACSSLETRSQGTTSR